MRKAAGVLVIAGSLLALPSDAAAQWFANPFFAKLSSVEFSEPTKDDPSAWGIAAGGGVSGIVGGEFDFTVSNGIFGDEDLLGGNKMQTFSGAAVIGYPIKIAGKTRIRPYGSIGGGLGILEKTEFGPDYDALENLPPQQQNAIYNCLFDLDEDPTRDQVTACGASVLEEKDTGYWPVLSYGGGVFGFLAPHIGVRADFRYFKQFGDDDEPFKMWRTTIGVVIH